MNQDTSGTGEWPLRTRVRYLLGWRRGRTVVGGAVLAGLVGTVLLSVWAPVVLLPGQGPHQQAGVVDAIVDAGIVAILVSVLAGLLYALWNGGPLLAAALPVLPESLGSAARGGRTVDQDFVFLLATGAAAATVAVYVAGYRRTGEVRPRPSRPLVDGLTLATGALAVAGGVLVDLGGAVGAHATDAVVFGWSLWLPAAVLTVGAWVLCYRTADADGPSAVAD